jgi:pilus assembly protein CpaB
MRPKSIALLLLALGCGLVASIGITEVMRKRGAESDVTTGDTQPVFVAISDVALGDQLTSQVLRMDQWPKDKVPPGAISRIEDVEGRRARTRLYPNDPILESKLLGKGSSGQGASALIPKGYRVVTVKVDAVSGGGSMILPGDRVDVMVHLVKEVQREIAETITKCILQDIKVFAVDDVADLEKDKEGRKSIAAKTVSLLVTPEQAAKVTMASQMGSIYLVMRSPEDDQQAPNAEARPNELFGSVAKADRSKESLTGAPDPSLVDKTKSFLDFLGSMKGKGKSTGNASSQASAEAKPPETWTMRLLKPSGVDEVTFERNETGAPATSSFGAWKVTMATGNLAGAHPTKDDPKQSAPVPQDPPAPTADPPAPPN